MHDANRKLSAYPKSQAKTILATNLRTYKLFKVMSSWLVQNSSLSLDDNYLANARWPGSCLSEDLLLIFVVEVDQSYIPRELEVRRSFLR